MDEEGRKYMVAYCPDRYTDAKMSRRTLAELTPKKRKNTLNLRYKIGVLQNKFSLVRSERDLGTKRIFPPPDSCKLSKGTNKKLWKEHFEGLLGQPPLVDDQPIHRLLDALPIKTGNFTTTKLREAIQSTHGTRRLDSMVFQQRYGSLNVSMI